MRLKNTYFSSIVFFWSFTDGERQRKRRLIGGSNETWREWTRGQRGRGPWWLAPGAGETLRDGLLRHGGAAGLTRVSIESPAQFSKPPSFTRLSVCIISHHR